MKLRTEAFPYPVLSPDTHENNDYIDTAFQCSIDTTQVTDENGTQFIKLEYEILLSNDEIINLIENKTASYMLDITCPATGFKNIYSLASNSGSVSIEIGNLYQRVEIYPLIVVTSKVDDFTSEDLNLEYVYSNETGKDVFRKFQLNPGDMIAFDEPTIKYLDYEPLGLKSLLKVVLDNELDEDSYSIDPNHDNELVVRMGAQIKTLWDNTQTREYLFMPVIKDCILIAIDEYRRDKESVQERKWAKLFLEVIDYEQGIDVDTTIDDLNMIAQKVSKKFGLAKIKSKVIE
jgi:hypothetical protein